MAEQMSALLAGAMAGICVDFSLYPIDTIKTRVQAKGTFKSNGGFRNLYRGMSTVAIGSAPSSTLFFFTYENVKRYCLNKTNPSTLFVSSLAASSCAELAACIIRVPIESMKQKAQAGIYSSTTQVLKEMLKSKSRLREFYTGWWSTICRDIPFACIQLTIWEQLKFILSKKRNDNKFHASDSIIAGVVAAAIASAVTTPLDVLKSRMMLLSRHEKESRIITYKYMMKNMHSQEGMRVWFKGIVPRVIWISTGGAVFLGMYDITHNFLTKSFDI